MIKREEYQTRRQTFKITLSSDDIAFIPSAQETLRNGDTHYRFRQDSDFYYLTGFQEPDALLVITGGAHGHSILFNRPRNLLAEQWSGKRLGQDDAIEILGVDEAFSIEELDMRLPDFLANKRRVYYALGRDSAFDVRIMQAWKKVKGMTRQGISVPDTFCDIAPVLSDMRLLKSSAEQALMRQAADITVSAHQRAMKSCRYRQYEYELEAEIGYVFTQAGCRASAYDSIIAGGHNACVLHYTDNNQPLRPGDLLLIDAGAEFHQYAADVTRTFPVNGQFSTEQRLIYELVLRAQHAGMACVKPGAAWNEIQQAIVRIITEGLIDLGILHGHVDDLIAHNAYKPFYMHSSGHWLGLDVHDCGRYKIDGNWRLLQPGMTLTVEPGLYIGVQEAVDSRWWNIGVRIEDDILVTERGFDNLTARLAVDVDDIEALMRD
jgi:Xaa-Pro aminopeptidase